MSFTYSVKFGAPSKNRITYDGIGRFITEFNEEAEDGRIVLFAPKNGLCLYVDEKLENIVGLEMQVGGLENLPATDIGPIDGTDGCVLPEWDRGKLIAGCKFLINFEDSVRYDEHNGIVILGTFSQEDITVRICENAYMGVGKDGALHCAVVAVGK